MLIQRMAVLASLALVAAACADSPVLVTHPTSAVRVINASRAPFDVLIDGAVASSSVGVASVSTALPVAAGAHVVGLRAGDGTLTNFNVQVADNQPVTTVAFPGAGSSFVASVLVDTGSIVPAGKSKLRVSHLAGGAAAIEFWRTQPDFQTPVHIMTPFLYKATSPYLQSDPGTWEVFVTSPGGTAKLATTGPVAVPAGERRTVALVDSAGVMKFLVIGQ